VLLNHHKGVNNLELFLRNLLPNEKNELHNREMHISGTFQKQDIAEKNRTLRVKNRILNKNFRILRYYTLQDLKRRA